MKTHGSSQFHPMFGPRCKATRILKAARHLAIEHFLFALLLGAISFTPVVVRAQQEYSHKVLIIYDQSDRLTPISNFDVAFRSRMEQGSQATYFYREFLDNEIPGNDPGKNAKFVEAFRSWIAQKYTPDHVDLVVAFGNIPSEPLPGVPTIYVGQPPSSGGGSGGAFVPILSGDEAAKTVELALRLNPDAKRLVLITGTSNQDRGFAQIIRQQLAPFENRLQIEELSGQTVLQMSQTVAALPKDSIVLMLTVRTDAAGKLYNSMALVDFLSPLSLAPIYSVVDTQLGHGVVGGYLINFEQMGDAAGKAGLEILAGKPAQSVKVSPASVHEWMFDDRQLKRWGITESALPAGSSVLFREVSLWSRYRWLIVAAASVLLVQMALILALLVHRRRLKASQSVAETLAHQLLHSQEEERRRIARELHDGSAQDVFAIKLGLTRLKSTGVMDTASGNKLQELLHVSDTALRNIRSMSYLLHPPLLEGGGLIPAVKWFVEGFSKRSEMKVDLEMPDSMPRFSEQAEMALFRVIQESLSNALRHSGSHVAFVQIRNEDHKFSVEIRDQGHGFDTSGGNGGSAPHGVGLAGMRERMREIGGELSVQSGTWGTTVQATLPLSRAVAAASSAN